VLVPELEGAAASALRCVDSEPLRGFAEPVDALVDCALPLAGGVAPAWPLSAWATPDPLASAAPTPRVIAPAPSHT
jgi:hypothetical protein